MTKGYRLCKQSISILALFGHPCSARTRVTEESGHCMRRARPLRSRSRLLPPPRAAWRHGMECSEAQMDFSDAAKKAWRRWTLGAWRKVGCLRLRSDGRGKESRAESTQRASPTDEAAELSRETYVQGRAAGPLGEVEVCFFVPRQTRAAVPSRV